MATAIAVDHPNENNVKQFVFGWATIRLNSIYKCYGIPTHLKYVRIEKDVGE